MTKKHYAIAIVTILSGCADYTETKQSDRDSHPEKSRLAEEVAAPLTAGSLYQHTPSVTHFPLKGDTTVENGETFERIVSSRGAFLTDRVTHGTLAVRHASSKSTSRADAVSDPSAYEAPPKGFTQDPDQHNKAAKDYFISIGLPIAEIGGMHVTTMMSGASRIGGGPTPPPMFMWYTSHMERKLGGILVEGSHAFAAIDTNGDLITESVYWPAIPLDVVQAAAALDARLKSASERATFLAKARAVIPIDDATGQVKIIHTSWTHHGAFEAHAVYDVLTANTGKRANIHFNENGERIVMPEERPSGELDSVKLTPGDN